MSTYSSHTTGLLWAKNIPKRCQKSISKTNPHQVSATLVTPLRLRREIIIQAPNKEPWETAILVTGAATQQRIMEAHVTSCLCPSRHWNVSCMLELISLIRVYEILPQFWMTPSTGTYRVVIWTAIRIEQYQVTFLDTNLITINLPAKFLGCPEVF